MRFHVNIFKLQSNVTMLKIRQISAMFLSCFKLSLLCPYMYILNLVIVHAQEI